MAGSTAAGILNSGNTEAWQRQLERDRQDASALRRSFGLVGETYATLGPAELEAKLVEIHGVRDSVERLSAKYREAMAADAATRDRIRSDTRWAVELRAKTDRQS